jgi:hypothetical protein
MGQSMVGVPKIVLQKIQWIPFNWNCPLKVNDAFIFIFYCFIDTCIIQVLLCANCLLFEQV